MSVGIIIAIVAGILGSLGTLVAAAYGLRNKEAVKAAEDAAAAWRRERDAELAYRQRLTDELAEAKAQIKVLEARVDDLSRRPDLTHLEQQLANHETRAQQRSESLVAALNAITMKLSG